MVENSSFFVTIRLEAPGSLETQKIDGENRAILLVKTLHDQGIHRLQLFFFSTGEIFFKAASHDRTEPQL
jgi:hypothetical protein